MIETEPWSNQPTIKIIQNLIFSAGAFQIERRDGIGMNRLGNNVHLHAVNEVTDQKCLIEKNKMMQKK